MSKKTPTVMTEEQRKEMSNEYYKQLMSEFSMRKVPRGQGDKPISFDTNRILEEVDILSKAKRMTEKLSYNKYYWNMVGVTDSLKTLPEDKPGNFAQNMAKDDVKKHFERARKICKGIIDKMEGLYLSDYNKKKKRGQSRRTKTSIKDFFKPMGEETYNPNENQFADFITQNFSYKDWSQANKKTKLAKEDKKWLKTLRGGGMEEVFKQKICEAHFLKVYESTDYPIRGYVKKLVDHLKKSLGDMERSMFCNMDKLVKDIANLKDLMANTVVEGYKTQMKGLEKHNFPLGTIKVTLWKDLIKGIGKSLVPLYHKFFNKDLEENLDDCREYLLLDRLPINKNLTLPNEQIPYKSAIDKFSSLTHNIDIDEMLKIVEETYSLVFKCIDTYYEKEDKSLVGMKILDTDLSQVILYVMINSNVLSLASWFNFIEEFRSKTQNYPIFNLFFDIVKWTKEISIQLPEDSGKFNDDGLGKPTRPFFKKPQRPFSMKGGTIKPKVRKPNSLDKKKQITNENIKRSSTLKPSVTRKKRTLEMDSEKNSNQPEFSKKGNNNPYDGGEIKRMSNSSIAEINPEDDKKVLELEKSITEKNMMVEMLERKLLTKLQNVRRKLNMKPMDDSIFL